MNDGIPRDPVPAIVDTTEILSVLGLVTSPDPQVPQGSDAGSATKRGA